MRRVWRPRRGTERRQRTAGTAECLAIVDPGTSRLRFLVVEAAGGKATVWGWDDVPGRPEADAHQLHLVCEEMLARAETMARDRSDRWFGVDQMLVGLPASQLLGRASTFTQRRAEPEQAVDEAELETLLGRGLRLAVNRLQDAIPRKPGAGGMEGSTNDAQSSEWLLVDATIVALTVDGRRVTDPVGFRGEELGATIFVALAHAETIETWRTVAMALEFSTLTLTAAPLAVVLGLSEPQGVLVDVGGETTDLTLWQAARPVALASLPTGGAALTRALVRTWGLSLDMAERLKQTYARGFLEEDEERQVQEVMFPVLRTWWEETEIRLAQLNMDEGLPQWLYLLGGGSALPDMVEATSALAWSERLHFERYPQVGRIQPHDVPGVVNRTDLGRSAGDVPALALAAWTALQNQPCGRPVGILRDLCQGSVPVEQRNRASWAGEEGARRMIRIGATTLPVAGWAADPRSPEASRELRLAAIRQVVTGYGLSAVELTLDFAAVYPQVFDVGFYRTVADLQQELGFICTAHLPFLWVAPSSLNESLRQASADCLCRAIEATRPVEVQTYVLHLWGTTSGQVAIRLDQFAQREAIIAGMMVQARRSLAQLCKILDPRDLCLENLDDPLFEAVVPLVEEVGASICLDVGHLPWRGDNEQDFLAQYGCLIREVHLHDAVGASSDGSTLFRDHLALGQGQIDYVTFLRNLEEAGYEGAVILEMNNQHDLEESLERVKSFL